MDRRHPKNHTEPGDLHSALSKIHETTAFQADLRPRSFLRVAMPIDRLIDVGHAAKGGTT
jgi:hypothetical protein